MSEIIYGCMSTMACMCLVSSVVLAHFASSEHLPATVRSTAALTFYRRSSIFLRVVGKIIALLNAVLILLVCIFQFSNFFDRCWCNSSYIQRQGKAYAVLDPTSDDLREMRDKWIPGLALAAVVAALYLGILNIISPKIRR